jgi:DNA excision repair protein ERCC-3
MDAEMEDEDEDEEERDTALVDESGNVSGQVRKKKEDLVLEILPKYIEPVKEACIMRNYPLIEEYDFKRDKTSPDLKIELKSSTSVRSYQE